MTWSANKYGLKRQEMDKQITKHRCTHNEMMQWIEDFEHRKSPWIDLIILRESKGMFPAGMCKERCREVFYVLFYFTPLCSSKDWKKANTVKTLLAFGDDTPQYIYIYTYAYMYIYIYIYVGTHFFNLFNFIGNFATINPYQTISNM